MNNSRPTIRQVAERAGVSRMTVSNVLHGRSSKVSEATRALVVQALHELEYAPVAQPAMQSRHVETRIIGLVFDAIEPEDYWGILTFRGLRQEAEAAGYDLLTVLRKPESWMLDREGLNFLDRRSDGFIFLLPQGRYGVLETLVNHGIPVVACCTTDVPPGVATVELDNAKAMQLAVAHLVEHGHQRIGYFAGDARRSDFKARLQGYRQGIKVAGLEPHVLSAKAGHNVTDEAIIALVEREGITAIACPSDEGALRLWALADARGWRVPEELSLVGMDNVPAAAERGLSSIGFCSETIGLRAVQALVRQMQDKTAGNEPGPVSRDTVPVELVQRRSVAAPACL